MNLPSEAQGAVMCSYRLLRTAGDGAKRLDVRFGPGIVVWGAPDDQFEAIEDDVAA
ncbi:hypothetical protein K9U39_13920 [Rhodoblastus acidophilus]|uniref:Uncharacterized protein n=1 Tax=Candidatus Rhodoblastus alkanivorans TaxID=2954117 RepID=A0ABS9ZCR5_9HYPH|nr:hypothetical protein [Candidatus Rhodoblastus alkanivorans]MCI4677796.1 hypothetical protein [Candidatus Rhodoblastus alkanivorans]MCI4684706.1 hypothetical protein [Candidatus Rhodoblastus alkanivorans]MDI4642028.1 hypothetical protein [Rhodoblastus acidophilus]